jgi:hypothetical protein
MASGASVQRNINTIRRNIKNMKKEVRQKTIEAFEDVVLDLADKALNLAPKDTGRLRKSADPEVKVKHNKVTATVTFSAKNPDTGYDYAMIQHEDMSFKHPNGGQAKFLEQPLKENQNRYRREVANKIREATR